jgi:hypothetical protein
MSKKCCSNEKVMVLACSGGSNVGQISNQAGIDLTREGYGNMFCLAGIGGSLKGFVNSAMYVLEYLVAHELVHLMENNHTPKFWNILSIQIPNYEKSKKWLKEKGQLLEIDF